VAITSGEGEPPDERESGEGYVAYELHEWARETRLMLQQLLEADDIPYVWESTDLVVPGAFEKQVDAIVHHVDAAAEPALDPDADKLLYELAEWSDEEATRLASELDDVEIPYDFDIEGNLIVLADDEQRVEEILDSIEFPDALQPGDDDEADGDGLEAQEVLSALFLAADRLRRNASDPDGVLQLVDAVERVGSMRLPFGFEPRVWDTIVARASELKAAIEGDEASDDDIEASADQLRALLSTLV
jgi:hypothetical protein